MLIHAILLTYSEGGILKKSDGEFKYLDQHFSVDDGAGEAS